MRFFKTTPPTGQVRRLTIDGHDIYTLDTSPELSGPCFVLVHGIGVSSRYFAPLHRELSQHNRVISIDLPGFGASTSSAMALSIADLATVAVKVLDQLGITHAVLVGHSMGCQVVTEMYLQQPAIASRLVLIGPTVDQGRRSVRRHFGRLFQDSLRERPRLDAIMVRDYFRCGAPRYFRTLQYMLEDHLEDRLASCHVPTLIIRGVRDPICKHDWAASAVNQLPDGSLLEIPGTAHGVQYSHPVQVAEACRKCLDD